jgi:hypothetical protein
MVTLLILAFSTLDNPSLGSRGTGVWNVVAVRRVDGGQHDRSPPAAAPAYVTADPLDLPVLPPLSFGQNSRSIFLFQQGKVARIINGLNGGSPHARRVELQSRSPAALYSPTPSPANALPHGACKVHWPPPVVRSGRTRRHVHNVCRRSSAAAAGRRRGDALHQ